MHTVFSLSGHRAKLECLTQAELQKGHLWQGEAQEPLPEFGRKPSPPVTKPSSRHRKEPPLPCPDSHPHTSVSSGVPSGEGTANSPTGHSGHPTIQTDPTPDEKPALLVSPRRGAGAPLKPGTAAQPGLLLAKTDVFQSLCASGSSMPMIRLIRMIRGRNSNFIFLKN